MNHDHHSPDMYSWIEPELEARVVAWVAGEASAFEIAELERLTAEKPELAIFKRRIETVHGLVVQAVKPDKTPLRLSPERRVKLRSIIGERKPLHVAGGPGGGAPARKANPVGVFSSKTRPVWHRVVTIAAGLMLGLSVPALFRMITAALREPAHAVALEEKAVRPPSTHPPVSADQLAEMPEVHAEEYRKRLSSELESRERAKRESSRADKGAARNVTFNYVPSYENLDAAKPSAEDPNEIIEMEPFEVNAPDVGSRGYAAATTLAGSRAPSPPLSLADASKPRTFSLDSPLTLGVSDAGNKTAAKSGPAITASYERADRLLKDTWGTTARASTKLAQPAVNSILAGVGAPGGKNVRGVGLDGPIDRAAAPAASAAAALSPPPAGLAPAESDAVRPRPGAVLVQNLTGESDAVREAVSTFSLHVSDASFRLAQAALARGQLPDPAGVRPEEFYNAINYGDPAPSMAEKVSCRVEQAAHPFLQQRNLVRIALQVASSGRGMATPLRLTILLDTSGSMEREDRAAAVQRAFEVLVSLLGPQDRISVIGFSRQPRLLADQLAGDKAADLPNLVKNVPAEGGTHLEAALQLASEVALRQKTEGAQNRIVLLTDGAANLGNADPAQLAAKVEELRQRGIAFDACGVGLEGLDDAMLESLTRKGDGRYYVLNTAEAADTGFAKQLAGAFRPAAQNVKVQVRFNPSRVGNYRLIGFEKHRLNEEDFRNDNVDAAELAAEEAAVALYQVEAKPDGQGEMGEVLVRFRDALTGNMVERSWTLPYEPQAAAFDRATPTLQLAGLAAAVAEKLRGGPPADAVRLEELRPIVNDLRGKYASDARIQSLVTMFQQVERMQK